MQDDKLAVTMAVFNEKIQIVVDGEIKTVRFGEIVLNHLVSDTQAKYSGMVDVSKDNEPVRLEKR